MSYPIGVLWELAGKAQTVVVLHAYSCCLCSHFYLLSYFSCLAILSYSGNM
jgi:hypothetical protein